MHYKTCFVVLVLLIAFSGCIQEREPEPSLSPFENMVFEPLVKGCAETEHGMASKGQGFVESEPGLKAEGNALVYSRAVSHLCCRKATISKALDNGLRGYDLPSETPSIVVFEDWSGPGCKCVCSSELEAKFENLPKGPYNVKVVSRGFDPESGENFEEVLLEETVSVPRFDGEPSLDEMKACQSDEGCVLVQEGCCPCVLGGKRVAVNSGFSEQYDSTVLEECKRSSGACVSLEEDPSCSEEAYAACVEGKCSVWVADKPLLPCPGCEKEAVD